MKNLWKRSISLLLVACTLVGYIVLPDVPAAKAETETVTTNPNLVANGTFETTLADGTVQANKDGWGYVAGMASIVAEEGKEGNYVAQIADNSDASTKYIYYEVTAEPGASYTFKVDMKGGSGSGIMQMLGGFSVLRMSSMMGMMNISFTKEELLKLNKQLNRIRKPKAKK